MAAIKRAVRRYGLNGALAIERLERLEPTDEESLFGIKNVV